MTNTPIDSQGSDIHSAVHGPYDSESKKNVKIDKLASLDSRRQKSALAAIILFVGMVLLMNTGCSGFECMGPGFLVVLLFFIAVGVLVVAFVSHVQYVTLQNTAVQNEGIGINPEVDKLADNKLYASISWLIIAILILAANSVHFMYWQMNLLIVLQFVVMLLRIDMRTKFRIVLLSLTVPFLIDAIYQYFN